VPRDNDVAATPGGILCLEAISLAIGIKITYANMQHITGTATMKPSKFNAMTGFFVRRIISSAITDVPPIPSKTIPIMLPQTMIIARW